MMGGLIDRSIIEQISYNNTLIKMNNHDSAYITQAPQPKNNNLRLYVGALNTKIDYAKWKQDLVLSYNYMPLANIRQKLQLDYALYLKKMQTEQAKLRGTIQNQEIITLLNNLSSYKTKLLKNAEQTQIKIQQQRVMVKKLQAQANAKKEVLKNIMRASKQKVREDLQSCGIQSARDLRKIVRSGSTISKISLTTRQPRSSVQQLVTSARQNPLIQLYQSCLKSLTNRQQKFTKLKNKSNNIDKYKQQSNQFLQNKESNRNTMQWGQFKKLKVDQLIEVIEKQKGGDEVLKKLLI